MPPTHRRHGLLDRMDAARPRPGRPWHGETTPQGCDGYRDPRLARDRPLAPGAGPRRAPGSTLVSPSRQRHVGVVALFVLILATVLSAPSALATDGSGAIEAAAAEAGVSPAVEASPSVTDAEMAR